MAVGVLRVNAASAKPPTVARVWIRVKPTMSERPKPDQLVPPSMRPQTLECEAFEVNQGPRVDGANNGG